MLRVGKTKRGKDNGKKIYKKHLGEFCICLVGGLLMVGATHLGVITVKAEIKGTYGDLKNVEYVRNYDGDTVTFNIKQLHPLVGHNIPIRVRGLDTPEIRGKCEQEKIKAKIARDLVKRELTDAKKIDLKNVARGKYFRIVANIEADGKDITQILLDNGLAVWYNGGTKNYIK